MINNIPLLCGDRCTACSACAQKCPVGAIEMHSDEKGFLQPIINEDICIRCHLCVKVCPILTPLPKCNNEKPKVYACWHKNNTIRAQSSSGGAFSAIAQHVLDQGGIVWGAAYTDNLKLTYQYVESITDLDKLRRSKYVQCEVGGAYIEVKKQLKQGKQVLFVATPCHIKGLYSYLEKDDCSKLLTVDFICHGVPSPMLFRLNKEYLECKYGGEISDYIFRDKRFGINYDVASSVIIDSKKYYLYGEDNNYTHAFLQSGILRGSCYNCFAKGDKRCSDFTIADFHGLDSLVNYKLYKEKIAGISLLIVNTTGGRKVFSDRLINLLLYEEKDYSIAVSKNYNFQNSTMRPPVYNELWSRINKEQWSYNIRLFTPSIKKRAVIYMKRLFGVTIYQQIVELIRK